MIPIYRLPFIAAKEVITSMDPGAMVASSKTSKKGKALLKSSLPNYRIPLNFTIGHDNFIVFFNGPNREKIFEHRLSEEDDLEENMIEYFIDIFNKPIVEMYLRGLEEEFALDLIRLVKSLPCVFRKLTFGYNTYTSEILKEILDECTDLQELGLENVKIPKGFKYVPPSPDAFKLQQLNGFETNWMKLEDFMHCKRISLDGWWDHPNEIQYLNNFFKTWRDSECDLEFIDIEPFEPDMFSMLTEGLSDRGFQRKGEEQYVEIERKDGKKAVISESDWRVLMEVKV